jgi:hypothetical protein
MCAFDIARPFTSMSEEIEQLKARIKVLEWELLTVSARRDHALMKAAQVIGENIKLKTKVLDLSKSIADAVEWMDCE